MASVAKRVWVHKGVEKTAWIVRYKDRGGAHRQKTFELKKMADAYRRRVEDEIGKGVHVAASASPTVKVLVDEYMADARVRLASGERMGQSHYAQLDRYLTGAVVSKIGNVKAADLTYKLLQDLYRELCSERRSPSLARRILYFFNPVLDMAVRRDYAARNLLSLVLKDLGGAPKRAIRTFSPSEVAEILLKSGERQSGCAARSQALTQLAVHLASLCGLRWGEVFGLTWGSLDFDNDVIEVRNSITHFDELKTPKTKAGYRKVPMPSVVKDMLEVWRGYYIENPRQLLFRLKNGAQMSVQNWHLNHWKPLLERCGLAPAECVAPPGDHRRVARFLKGEWPHFHALRHFYASALVNGAVPLPDVAQLVGHSSFDMTLRVYAHPTYGERRRHEAVAGLVERLIPGPQCATVTHGCLKA